MSHLADTRTRRGLALALALVLGVALAAATGCRPSAVTPGGVPQVSEPSTSAPATASATPPALAPTSPWPAVRLVRRWSGFSLPLFLTAPHDGSGRVYVIEKGGVVRIADASGRIEPTPLLDISGRVSGGGEQGLLSIAVPPAAGAPARIYAYYTDHTGDVVISRFPVRAGIAVVTAEKVVLRIPHRRFSNHDGGQLAFGPDGYLYAGIGDGGGGGDPDGNGENLRVLLAKLLRIDVEGVSTPGHTLPATYVVPKDNPFVRRLDFTSPEIWAYGLRNPWRFSFDAAAGLLYIGDVGQDAWEEIDVVPAGTGGQDYGWSRFEGLHTYPAGSTQDPRGVTMPVTEYSHDLGNAVVGGYVYRGTRYPAMAGVYFFADNGSGRLWGLRRAGGHWQVRQLAATGLQPAGFGVDERGELYVCDLSGGGVYQVTAR